MGKTKKSPLPPIQVTSFALNHLRFKDNAAIEAAVCPFCERWLEVRGSIISPHRLQPDVHGSPHCHGSRRLIWRDRPLDELRDEAAAAAQLARCRATRATPPPGERRRRTPPPALRPPRKEEEK